MIAPAQTYALIVAVEAYASSKADGRDMDLWGAACDGARALCWLLKRGLPPANIRLYANARPENGPELDQILAAHPQAAALWSQRQPPSWANLESFLDKILPTLGKHEFQQPDNALFVFWGGHGVAHQEGQRHLLFSDFELASARSLIVEDLLARLRKPGHIKRQIVFIDACADPVETKGLIQGLRTSTSAAKQPQALLGLHQEAVYSATEGEKARENKAGRAGFFSECLLRDLESLPPDAPWPPPMEPVYQAVKSYFDQLNQSAGTARAQRPVFVDVRFNGSLRLARSASGPEVDFDALCRRSRFSLPQVQSLLACLSSFERFAGPAARDELFTQVLGPGWASRPSRLHTEYDCANLLAASLESPALLAGLADAVKTQGLDLIRWNDFSLQCEAVARVQAAMPLVHDSTASQGFLWRCYIHTLGTDARLPESASAPDMLFDLARLNRPELLAEFLLRIAVLEQPANKEALKQHAVQLTSEAQANAILAAILREEHLSLLILVRTEPGPGGSEVPCGLQAWLRYQPERLVPLPLGASGELTVQGIADLSRGLIEVYNAAWKRLLRHSRHRRVELALPVTLMSHAFEDEALDSNGKPLGFEQPVLLRWRERAAMAGSRQVDAWRDWAESVLNRQSPTPAPLLLPHQADPGAFAQQLNQRPDLVVTWLDGGRLPETLLRQLLNQGLAFGLIVRDSLAGPEECRHTFACLWNAAPLRQLPELIHQERNKPAAGPCPARKVAVLWDSPREPLPASGEEDELLEVI